MKIIIEMTEEEFRNAVRFENPMESAKKPTKKMAKAMAIARSLNREDVAQKILHYKNSRKQRTSWDAKLPGWSKEVADAYFGTN